MPSGCLLQVPADKVAALEAEVQELRAQLEQQTTEADKVQRETSGWGGRLERHPEGGVCSAHCAGFASACPATSFRGLTRFTCACPCLP